MNKWIYAGISVILGLVITLWFQFVGLEKDIWSMNLIILLAFLIYNTITKFAKNTKSARRGK